VYKTPVINIIQTLQLPLWYIILKSCNLKNILITNNFRHNSHYGSSTVACTKLVLLNPNSAVVSNIPNNGSVSSNHLRVNLKTETSMHINTMWSRHVSKFDITSASPASLQRYHSITYKKLHKNHFTVRDEYCTGIGNNMGQFDCIIKLHTSENPHNVKEHYFQHHCSVNVWCGVLGNYLIGPHFTEGRLTEAYYRNFLQKDLPVYSQNVSLATQGKMPIHHDGAPPHFCRKVMQFLNDNYHGRWCHGPLSHLTYPDNSS
jgi:hypothetical protein